MFDRERKKEIPSRWDMMKGNQQYKNIGPEILKSEIRKDWSR